MLWIDEPDTEGRSEVNHALMMDVADPLLAAFEAFWERLLTDGCAKAGAGWTSLSVEIADRQVADDDPGYLRAVFHNGQHRPCAGLGGYYVRGAVFDCLQPKGESNDAFNRRQIRWFLDLYRLLKQAARAPRVQPLLCAITAIRPLPVSAATAFGWFDLQLDQDAFGPLPVEDQELLLGTQPAPPISSRISSVASSAATPARSWPS